MPGKILIVDDDSDFREAMTSLLKVKGYSIVSASDGEEGYAMAKSEKPDLILLDVMMANKTEGFDLARKINNDKEIEHIPVLLTTGIRKDMTLSFGIEPDEENLPVKAVLEKPIKPDVLLAEVEKNINK